MLSEIETAFLMGFMIFIPFMVIDLVVSAIMMSMGMYMLPPTLISLPFKILLFVLVDGWTLVVSSLLQSFHPMSPRARWRRGAMNDTTVLHLASQALVLIAELAGPVLVVSLVVGLVVSLFQAVTSIQEFTLTFLPKVVAIGLVLLFCGHWMLNDAVTFTEQLYRSIPNMVNAPG